MKMKLEHLVAFGLLLLVAGCTPWANYPPIEGAVGVSNPSLRPIPDLMADGIWYIYDRDGRQGELIFNLPEYTPSSVYDSVIHKLNDGAPMLHPDEPAIHVAEVRVRAMEAEVDMIHLDEGGVPELVTLSFKKNPFGGYRIASERPWRIRIDAPPPYYVPPPAEEAELATHP